jgi:hypothetical protein
LSAFADSFFLAFWRCRLDSACSDVDDVGFGFPEGAAADVEPIEIVIPVARDPASSDETRSCNGKKKNQSIT